uniref:Uncharacterized protein n=1 Tax=Anguilla anguilla TaxID=7936 RepID=A0A0E9SBE2_ANGAN
MLQASFADSLCVCSVGSPSQTVPYSNMKDEIPVSGNEKQKTS